MLSPTSSQSPEVHPIPDLFEEYADNEEEEEEEEKPAEPKPLSAMHDERPPLDRAVQVDELLDNWRSQIRKAGVKAEEDFLVAIKRIFETEKEGETSTAKNMISDFNNAVETEITSLKNTIIYLAKKGRASGQDDPRLTELNRKIAASGKKIRNHAVETR